MDESSTADRVDRAALSRRWRQEGRYEEIAEFREQVKEALRDAWRSAGREWDRDELNEAAWQDAARAFPALDTEPTSDADSESESVVRGPVEGLGSIPGNWPTLPANASLASEIGWVQANRLFVVEEKSSGATVVHLDRAYEPAPSRAAIGWLETSIRSYAKFVDVAAKASATKQTEAELVRRERLAIDEMRALLDEMHRD